MDSTVTPLYDIDSAPAPRPMNAQTRRALVAEWQAARDRGDVATGREIYSLAQTHDEAWPDEPSLHDQLLDLNVGTLLDEVA